MAKTNDNDDSGHTVMNRTHDESTDAWQPHHPGVSKNNHPGDAITLGINELSGFATFADVECPVFTAMLCKFILIHHQHTLHESHQRIRDNVHQRISDNVSGSVVLEDSLVGILNSHIDDGAAMTNADWQRLCTNLHNKSRASNQPKSFYVEFICKHLLFP